MRNIFENYIYSISSKFSFEETSEIGYRTDFKILLKEIFESIEVIRFDHDARVKTLIDFTQSFKEPIRSGENLLKIMGVKAQRI